MRVRLLSYLLYAATVVVYVVGMQELHYSGLLDKLSMTLPMIPAFLICTAQFLLCGGGQGEARASARKISYRRVLRFLGFLAAGLVLWFFCQVGLLRAPETRHANAVCPLASGVHWRAPRLWLRGLRRRPIHALRDRYRAPQRGKVRVRVRFSILSEGHRASQETVPKHGTLRAAAQKSNTHTKRC